MSFELAPDLAERLPGYLRERFGSSAGRVIWGARSWLLNEALREFFARQNGNSKA